MKYFLALESGSNAKGRIVCNVNNLEQFGFIEDHFHNGKQITNWPENIIFTADEKELDSDCADDALRSNISIPIFSERLRKEIDNAGIAGIQWLSVRVTNMKNTDLGIFFIANILKLVKALDMQKSSLTYFPKSFGLPAGTFVVKKYVLLSSEIFENDIFRIIENPSIIFVSEKFWRIYTKNKFIGFSFTPIELS